MAPKKKGGKRADDDWESEALGETPNVADTNGASAEAPEEEMGGGLMAALAKNRGKRAKKGKVVEDFVEGEDPPGAADTDANGVNLAEKAPEEATADDLFGEPTKGKGNKGGKNAKSTPAASSKKDEEDDDDDDDDAGTGHVKTKKEKEKEKKEREKQRKKEQAAKKKVSAPAPVPVPDKEDEKVAAKIAPPPESKASKPEPETGKSKKKVPAGLAALQKQLEQNKKREQEAERLRKEEEEQEREAERLEQERLQKEAEAKARRKEKEKEKKELLKKQGLLLTDAEKKRRQKMENAKQQLLASGVKVAGLDDDAAEDTKKADKKPSYDKRRKGPKKVDEQTLLAEAQKAAEAQAAQLVEQRERLKAEEEEAQRRAEEEAAQAADANDDDEDDWDKVAEEEDVKDSWDAESEEEESVPEEKSKSTPQPAAATAPKAVNGTPKPQEAQKQETLPHRPHIDRPIESDSESESDSDPEIRSATQRMLAQKKAEAAARKAKEHEEAMAARSKDNLRSPICCILGHVDTGKTKLLDKIRQTNVQEGEAGGITQQIGATYFPVEALEQKILPVNQDGSFEFKVPGLLVIDTPGHESFTNLRSRGSSLCNMAILVVDIMHGLEPQTLESMRLLRERKTPFIVALNKIDRLYNWKKIDNNGFQESLALQSKGVQNEFANRLEQTKLAFAEQGFNSELYYENKSMAKFVSLVPTSAHTGEGIPDLLKLLVQLSQERMTSKLMYLSTVECTVLEVKVIEGLGTTIDVVLSNGILREGDRIVLCGLNGAITTNIRALLTPAPLKELRVKSAYVHNQMVKAALGVKIAANDLEHAIAGSRLMVVGPNDDEEDLEEEVMGDIENLMSRVSKTGRGVSVQASTLGSLEALLEFLKVSKIPVANISIGPVYKRDVMQAGIMLEKAKEYAVMLCFDVKVDPAAQEYADQNGIKIFTADIIYHLFDNFTQHMAQLAEQKKEESKMLAVFPCVLTPVQVFNKKDPIVIGVDVTEGALRMHTPIAVVRHNGVTNTKEIISVGRVTSIERDHKQIQVCKKGQPSVAVKIEGPNQPMYGRQLEDKDILYSLISRISIDTLKDHFRSEVTMDEWALIKKLKVTFDIP